MINARVILPRIVLLFPFLVFATYTFAQTTVSIDNPSFESSNSSWQNLNRSNDGYYSPVEGDYYASVEQGDPWVSQLSAEVFEAGATYDFTVYARSSNLAQVGSQARIQMEFYNGSMAVWGKFLDVGIPHLQGAPEIYTNDDGANIWIDGNYRMQFNEEIMYQDINDDPITDPWTQYVDNDYDVNFALSQIHIPGGLKALHGTYYEEGSNPYSALFLHPALGSAPNYDWQAEEVILEHTGDEEPWVIDAHTYYDEDQGRLWMSWGGHKFWVSELDPATGKLLSNPSSKAFDDHPVGTHTQIAHFDEADAWSSGYQEGPALFKHDGFWYCFGTYGNLNSDYTIRVGRASNPQGPYYDKNGVDLNNNGGTLVFGDEGEQLVPGHPHIWEENGQHYIGYDYRKQTTGTEFDHMGIRKLFWVDGWPTIYQPVTLSINADDYPQFIGQPLGVRFRNAGTSGSRLAVDEVIVTKTTAGSVDLDQLFLPPSTAETDAVVAEWNSRDVACYNYNVLHTTQVNGLDVDIVAHDTEGLSSQTHYAFVRYPVNYDPANTYPILVSNHGGTNGTGPGALYSSSGCYEDFILVVPSYRGETLDASPLGFPSYISDGSVSEFDRDIDDALSLVNCVIANVSGAAANDITVMGGSRGGGVTYLMAIRDPRITRINVYFGATDHLSHPGYQERAEQYVNTGSAVLNPPMWTVLNYGVTPYLDGTLTLAQARQALLSRSVYYFIDLLPPLVQVHHGAVDFVVEVEHSQRLEQKMNLAGIIAPNFEYFEYADGNHGSNIDPNDLRRDFICNTDFDNDGSLFYIDCNDFVNTINPCSRYRITELMTIAIRAHWMRTVIEFTQKYSWKEPT